MPHDEDEPTVQSWGESKRKGGAVDWNDLADDLFDEDEEAEFTRAELAASAGVTNPAPAENSGDASNVHVLDDLSAEIDAEIEAARARDAAGQPDWAKPNMKHFTEDLWPADLDDDAAGPPASVGNDPTDSDDTRDATDATDATDANDFDSAGAGADLGQGELGNEHSDGGLDAGPGPAGLAARLVAMASRHSNADRHADEMLGDLPAFEVVGARGRVVEFESDDEPTWEGLPDEVAAFAPDAAPRGIQVFDEEPQGDEWTSLAAEGGRAADGQGAPPPGDDAEHAASSQPDARSGAAARNNPDEESDLQPRASDASKSVARSILEDGKGASSEIVAPAASSDGGLAANWDDEDWPDEDNDPMAGVEVTHDRAGLSDFPARAGARGQSSESPAAKAKDTKAPAKSPAAKVRSQGAHVDSKVLAAAVAKSHQSTKSKSKAGARRPVADKTEHAAAEPETIRPFRRVAPEGLQLGDIEIRQQTARGARHLGALEEE